MTRRHGRTRTNLEGKILAEMSAREKQAEQIVAQKINSNTPSIMAFEAACLLLAIEGGAAPATIQHSDFQKQQYAKKNGLHGNGYAPATLKNLQRTRAGLKLAGGCALGMARATSFIRPMLQIRAVVCFSLGVA
jgi:hypothetical protein